MSGTILGLLTGGAILSVLALQVNVVEWPEADLPGLSQAPAPGPSLPDASASSPVAQTPVVEPVPTIAPAPAPIGPGPEMVLPESFALLSPQPEAGLAGFDPLAGSVLPRGAQPSFGLAALTVQSPAQAEKALAKAVPAPFAMRDVQVVSAKAPEFQPLASIAGAGRALPRRDGAANRTTPMAQDLPVLRSAPERLALAVQPASPIAPAQPPRSTDPVPQDQPIPLRPSMRFPRQSALAPVLVSAGSSASAAPRLGTDLVAPRDLPRPVAAAPRAPMILWLAQDDAPDGPEWLLRPDGELADLGQKDFADAKAVRVAGKADASRLAAPLAQGLPLLLSERPDPSLAMGLRAKGGRFLQPYWQLAAEDSQAGRDNALARIADRARRDGVVMVVLESDPALWAAVEAWKTGPGSDFDAARLSDVFGG